jgi:hypothetical protein
MKMKLLLLSLGIVLTAICTVVQAETITLDAVQDTKCVYYDNGSSAGRSLNYDGQQLWVGRITTPARYYDYSIYQFDLSSLPGEITSAHLELYDTATSSWQTDAFSMENYVVTPKEGLTDAELEVVGYNDGLAFDKDGMHEEYMTCNAYSSAANVNWMESSTVMALNIDPNTTAGWYSSADADSGLLADLNTNRTGKGYAVVLGWYITGGGLRVFDDIEGGHAPRLVVDCVPEPGTLVLLAAGCVGLLLCARKKS